MEYLDNILVPLNNFISKGTEVFLACKSPDYLAQVLLIASTCGDINIASNKDNIAYNKHSRFLFSFPMLQKFVYCEDSTLSGRVYTARACIGGFMLEKML